MSDLISRQAKDSGDYQDSYFCYNPHHNQAYLVHSMEFAIMQKGKTMDDMMTFPETVEEFMNQYKITDTEQIYTNGAELVPIFRMKQWFEHKPSAQPEPAIPLQWIEAQIEWLKSLDNAFSTLTAGQISAMVNKWEDEQDG